MHRLWFCCEFTLMHPPPPPPTPPSFSGQPPASAPGCFPCGGKGCTPCRGSLVCLSLACSLMVLHLINAVMGTLAGVGSESNPFGRPVIYPVTSPVAFRLLYPIMRRRPYTVVFGLALFASLTAVIAGCVAACANSNRVVRSCTIAVIVGSIIAFCVQLTLAIDDAVTETEECRDDDYGAECVDVYWDGLWTVLAFVTSLLSSGLSIGALVLLKA